MLRGLQHAPVNACSAPVPPLITLEEGMLGHSSGWFAALFWPKNNHILAKISQVTNFADISMNQRRIYKGLYKNLFYIIK